MRTLGLSALGMVAGVAVSWVLVRSVSGLLIWHPDGKPSDLRGRRRSTNGDSRPGRISACPSSIEDRSDDLLAVRVRLR